MTDPRIATAYTDTERTPGAAYLALVTVVALGLRLLRLDGMSLWIDEVFTWDLVAPGRGLRFGEQILAAYQGPLYHAAVWPLVRVADTAFMLRLPAALAGALAVPVGGILAGRLFGRTTGRLAALFFALSPFAVWYAQEARGYSFLILFSMASALVLWPALDRGPSPGRAIGLALLFFAGLASNFAFVFLLVAFGLTVMLAGRPRTRSAWLGWCLAFGGGVLLAAPWLLEAAGIWEVGRVVPGATTGEALRGESTFHPGALPFTGFALLNGFTLGPSLAELHGPDRLAVLRGHVPALLLGTLPAIALLLSLRRLDERRWHLLLWIVIPLAGVSLLAMRNIKPYNVRYAAAALPWVLILLAAGAGSLRGRWRAALGVGLCLVFLVSLGGLYLDGRFAKADLRGAVAAMRLHPDTERPVLVPTVGPVVRYYWPEAVDVRGCWDEPQVDSAAAADRLVERQLAGCREVWVVWARTWYLDPGRHLPSALMRQGTLERVYEGDGVAVDRWRRRAAAPAAGGSTP